MNQLGIKLNEAVGHSTHHDYIQASTAHNTRKTFQASINAFIKAGYTLPASPESLTFYLNSQSNTKKSQTLKVHLSAIASWHITQGLADPTKHPLVLKTMKGITRVKAYTQRRAIPLNLEQIENFQKIYSNEPSLRDLRNNAMIQLGFFGYFRRSELVSIKFEHLIRTPEGIKILIPRSKTNQEGPPEEIGIPYSNGDICPVTSLFEWLEASKITYGYIFPPIRNNCIMRGHITDNKVNLIIKEMVDAIGEDSTYYSGHSLRRGGATQAYLGGAPDSIVMKHGRWKRLTTMMKYREDATLFQYNAVDYMGIKKVS